MTEILERQSCKTRISPVFLPGLTVSLNMISQLFRSLILLCRHRYPPFSFYKIVSSVQKRLSNVYTTGFTYPQSFQGVGLHLLAYNQIRGVMAKAARGRDMQPRELSFNGARQTIREFEQSHLYEPKQIALDSPVLLALIAQKRVGD